AFNSADEKRKEKILSHTESRGVDLAIVATGSLKAFEDAIDVVRKGGTVMMFGVPSKGATIDLDMSIVYSKEITIVTSYAASDHDTKEALELIHSKKVDAAKLITHKYSLDESQKAFDHARDGTNAMKIIITK
ncbi:MAG: zinc-binding dehydrogenase, partial [Nitrosopumilaceae archaeon]|nr:zinc-binding dehydrogenase [Nitrosopumilaceae archaeon]